MKKLSVLLFIFSAVICSCAAQPLAIGSKVNDFKLEVWYQNKKAPVEKWLGKKTVAILFVTTTMPDPLMLRRIDGYARTLKKKNVEIFFVANGLPKNAKNVPAWKNLKHPVAFDLKSELFKSLGGTRERIPFWVVITPQRELAWRGKVNLLPTLIRELESGKYKVADAARREKFTDAIGKLLREKKYLPAINLITKEQKFEPGNVELAGLKANLFNRLKKPDMALREIDKAIAAKPEEIALYEFKLRFIRQVMPGKDLLPVFKDIAARFKKRPNILLGLVKKEMAQPLNKLNPEGVYILARAAAEAPKFRNAQEQGIIRLAYARILHYCGKVDMAVQEADKAVKLLEGKNRKSAQVVRDHFFDVLQVSRKIK